MHLSSYPTYLALSSLVTGSIAGVAAQNTNALVACLKRSISAQGAVVVSGDSAFSADTTRWSSLNNPSFSVVTEVANENDVRASINCATQTNTTFFVTGPKHGVYTGLANVKNGLQIYTAKHFTDIALDTASNTVTVGGAVKFQQLIDVLAASGKNMPVGGGACVGIVGASLGGGLARLQGLYGYISDNLLSARLMLPNTTVVTVSQQSNPDLFWALRGAGFNFGVVLNATYQVYNAPVSDGSNFNADFEWPLNQSKAFYTALQSTQLPAPLCVETLSQWNPKYNQTTLVANAVYAGPEADGRKAVQFLANVGGQLRSNYSQVPWSQLTANAFFLAGNPILENCDIPGGRALSMGVAVNEIEPEAHANMSYQFNDLVTRYPQMQSSYNTGIFCGSQAVRAKPDNFSSFPWRQAGYYQTWGFVYGDDTTTDASLGYYPERIRATIANNAGTNGLEAYVGFSKGDESLESIFGKKNLPRLAALKKQYDPHGLFNNYHPLPTHYP